MKRALLTVIMAVLLLAVVSVSPASAAFGFEEVSVSSSDRNGDPALQAGSHPFAVTVGLAMNTKEHEEGGGLIVPDGAVKELIVNLPVGFAGDPLAVPRCSAADFVENSEAGGADCPNATAVGFSKVRFSFSPVDPEAEFLDVPVFNLIPPPGVAARLGFAVLKVPVIIDFGLTPNHPYRVQARVGGIAQAALFYSSRLTTWGDPSSSLHDSSRGICLGPGEPSSCPVEPVDPRAFITLPRSCDGPLRTEFFALAWNTGETDTDTAFTEPGTVDCPRLGFEPRVSAQPTSDHAESPAGLEFNLTIDDQGLTNPKEGATADSDIKRVEVTLPEGVTINPSQAEGLAVCTETQLGKETAASDFGEGCPSASRIGSIEVETPILEGKILKGSLFVAEPHANLAGDSLIAFYIVIKSRELGIVLKQPVKVEPDPQTGQLIAIAEDLPQQPFSDFRLRFREGGRSPLVTPNRCGTFETRAVFTPWANPDTTYSTGSSFQIVKGVGGGPCPQGSTPPFEPGLSAGTLNPTAATYSPFSMRLTRRDGDQDLTKFSAILPQGLVPKLAGVEKCPQAQIDAAKGRPGRAELASPSCPSSSKIGTTFAGAGVGSQLTYVPGSIYLAGPYKGAPLSAAVITPAVAGPFDVGTVVVQVGLNLDQKTFEGLIDGSASDPIPHILAGIPLRVRDIRVNVDRQQFILNPTSCDPMSFRASIWGGGTDVFSSADDTPVSRALRFQIANCANLKFKPRLNINLNGGVKRGEHPALRATYTPREGQANLKRLLLTFPRSAFVENAHFRTICTRVAYAAKACPPGSIYGNVKAWSPLLDEPLEGPVYLRSSDNLLPDAIFALRGVVDVEVAVRIDSRKGRLRATVASAPDVPVSKVVVQMQGGNKGLFVNSKNICRGKNRGLFEATAQSGKRATLRPRFEPAGCTKKKLKRPPLRP